jgi:NAD-dependent SIR2 family protein deacetylase
MVDRYDIVKAAQLIGHAQGLLITAGAGMGVDSGLPDFRGPEGFWQSYPALRKAGLGFRQVATPRSFWTSPRLAWGFYGHRLGLYRRTPPHAGFDILHRIADRLPAGAFVYTSNVDGQFQQAGFAETRIHECHGSIQYLQCLDDCSGQVWPARGFDPVVDEAACRLLGDLPVCPRCGLPARPNVLMFEDVHWVSRRYDEQYLRLQAWLDEHPDVVVIELGAGTDVATVRAFGESLGAPFIRVNPREARVRPSMTRVSLAADARPALEGIGQELVAMGFFGIT